MARVKPFRGVRYDPARFTHMEQVVAQPYDRIDSALQRAYHDLNPYNIIRIILGQPQPGDDPLNAQGPNVYTRARQCYDQWLAEGVLIRDPHPAYLAYEQTFSVMGRVHVRLGLIAAVELTDYAEGVILPHEKTHAGPKEDRLRLLRTLEANSEQIFILYPDSDNRVNALVRGAIADRAPDIDICELWERDVRQRLWVLHDPALLAQIEAQLAPKRGLIIADGHHRYATGLTYRDEQRARHPDAPRDAAFNFVQATLVSMDDPDLVILPTHREICHFTAVTPALVLQRARDYFTIAPAADLNTCLHQVNAHPEGHAFGFYGGAALGFHVLTLKNRALIETLIPGAHSPAWKALSVSVLHKIVLEHIAQVPASGIEDQSMIRYHRDPQVAINNIDQGLGNFVCFVSPTRMDQIKTIAYNGETMPQKSTDFYPKVISGLSLLPLSPDDVL